MLFLKKKPSGNETITWIFECYSLFKSAQISFVDYECSRHLPSSVTYSSAMVLYDIHYDR